ncbi:MAG: hypothetical protein Q8Q23_04905 [bacterium]|nr:hypothetical protein [bacterium]
MFQYLEKFKKLSKELQQAAASPTAIQTINELEKKYGIALDADIIKIMVKEIPWSGVANYFAREHNLSPEQADALRAELKENLFAKVAPYLEINSEEAAAASAQMTLNVEPKAELDINDLRKEDKVVREAVNQPGNQVEVIEEIDQGVKKIQTENEADEPPYVRGEIITTPGGQLQMTQPEKEALSEELISLAGIADDDEEMANRLKIIATIFLKGIRDDIDTRETLMKNKVSGGLGLDEERAGKIIARLKQSRGFSPKFIEARPQPIIGIDQIRDVEYKFDKTAKENTPAVKTVPKLDFPAGKTAGQKTSVMKKALGKIKLPKNPLAGFGKVSAIKQLAPLPPVAQKVAPGAKSEVQTKIQARQKPSFQFDMEDVKKIESQPAPAVQPPKPQKLAREPVRISRQEVEPNDKQRMSDIIKQKPSRLQGPIEELANLDLNKFTRLGESPEIIVNKIKQKIDLLEEESMTKRQQGINAWRTSPVYKMYLALGQESLVSHKPMDAIISEKAQAKQNILTYEQFNSILDLNRQLQI